MRSSSSTTLLVITFIVFSFSCMQLRADITEAQKAVVVIQTNTGQGSGVLLESGGVIVTNLHVIEDASDISVLFNTNERYEDVSVIDFDAVKDIALLKVKAFDLPVVKLGNSNNVKSGQDVFAIGTPLGYEQTVSRGIVSSVRMMEGGFKAIQTDAAISPGSSGGGLFTLSGELIGILTAFREDGQNLNFAVPINYVRGMMNQPIKYTESEFTALNVQTPSFGEGITDVNNATTVEGWIRRLSADFDDITFEPIDEDSYLISIDELNILAKLFDSLLWITTPVDDPHESSYSALTRLLELSQQMSYAYVGLENGTVSVNYELPVTGSTYEAFELGILAIVNGFITVSEELVATSGDKGNEKIPDITQNKDTTGMRYVEPGDLDVAIGYRAFDWDVEETNDSATFTHKRETEKYVKIYVESLAVEIVDDQGISAILNTYLESQESYQDFSIVNTGTRSVEGELAAWGQYSMVSEGLKFYSYTTTISNDGRLVTLHTWSGTADWDALEKNAVEFLKNIKW